MKSSFTYHAGDELRPGANMTLGAFLSSGSRANDAVVETAGHLAVSQHRDLLLIGLVDVPGWIRSFAPPEHIGHLASDVQAELESQIRKYICLLPATVAVRYACCSDWSDPKLSQLLSVENCSTLVASLSKRTFRDRRRLEALAKQQNCALVMVPAARMLRPDGRDHEPAPVAI
jgi:hypothetical protein